MLPNRFPDSGEAPEFNAVDASLWYVIAVHDFLAARRRNADRPAVRDPARRGRPDPRRLPRRHALSASGWTRTACSRRACPGVQLTWMDAKVGDWVVTPRIGKPVEVQALWLNALKIGRRLAPEWAELHRDAARRRSRAVLERSSAGCLYDVVDVDHEPGRDDAALRPNQILAVGGLPSPLLGRARRHAAWSRRSSASC